MENVFAKNGEKILVQDEKPLTFDEVGVEGDEEVAADAEDDSEVEADDSADEDAEVEADDDSAEEAEAESDDESDEDAEEDAEEDTEADEAEDTDAALFPELEKPVSQKTFRRRVNQLTAKLYEAREASTKAQTEAKAAREAMAAQAALTKLVGKHYGRFKNPANQLAADAAFMEELENLSQSDPSARVLADNIKNRIRGRTTVSETTTPVAPEAAPAKPARDPAVETLLREAATTKIAGHLEGVKPSFVKAITKAIVSSGADLSALDRETVLRHAKAYVQENEFEAHDVIEGLAPAKAKKGKPATGRQGRAVTEGVEQGAAGEDGATKASAAAKTLNEWRTNRDSRIRKILGGR